MADEVRDELGSMRRDMRRIEDDLADIARKKASNADVEPVVRKQTELETFTRTRLEALHNDNEDIRGILKRIADSLTSIDERLTRHKRETDDELASVKEGGKKAPAADRGSRTPLQWQLALYMLAGVGLLALLQGAPQALLNVFPSLARGGF